MLTGRTGLSPVMVGRSAELRQLAGLLRVTDAPAVALITGEAGIGKTRLIQELADQTPAGTVVLAGQADPGTAVQPLQLLLDILKGAPDDASTGPAGAAGDGAGELAKDLAVVTDVTQGVDERVAAGLAVIRRLTAERTGLVVFEDLHWADPESLRVFERLAEPSGAPLVVVGTIRPDGLNAKHPAASLVPRLKRRQQVTQLHLTRLSPADVAAFLTRIYKTVPSYRIVEALHSRTGGNPFFLEELLAASANVPCDDLDSAPLPWTVAEVVQNQVDELDPDVRRMVNATSVLGRRVAFDLLAAVTGSTEDELIELLRAAVESGLLLEVEPDYFGFRHELAREAIKNGLLGRERRRLHQKALDTLRAAGSTDHAALAYHARGAGRHEDMVEEARLGAHDLLARGASYQALQLAEMGLTEAEDDFDLLAVATESAWLAGLGDEMITFADRWLALARDADDVTQEAAALRLRIRAAFEAADGQTMAALTDALIETIDRLPDEEARAGAMAYVAQSYMLRELVEPTCEWADKAHALAETYDLASVRLAAMVEKGSVLLVVREGHDEGKVLLEEAITEAEALGEHVLAARALNNLLAHEPTLRSAENIEQVVRRIRSHTKAAGWRGTSFEAVTMASVAMTEGDMDGAIARLESNPSDDHDSAAGMGRRLRAVFRAGLALEAGDLELAQRLTADARSASTHITVGVLGLKLHIACRRGEADRARALLTELMAMIEKDGYAEPAQVHDLVSAALAAGLTPAELRPLASLAGLYAGHRLPEDDPWRQFIEAQLVEAEGDLGAAAELYVAAASSLENSPELSAGQWGTAHVGAARCLVALGRLHEARQHAVAAADLLARWRGWRVEELGAIQRRLGLSEGPSGPDALTPREREVAQLLADGLTNAQLAEQLYISPRTAAVHVSNILAKLGMSSRTEVAAWAAAGGLE